MRVDGGGREGRRKYLIIFSREISQGKVEEN
jgi:hypothetical protein